MCGNMMFGGFWIIPMAICILMMFSFGFHRRRGFCGSGMHYSDNFNKNNQGESALDILNKRYAKGEIEREEYEKIKREI